MYWIIDYCLCLYILAYLLNIIPIGRHIDIQNQTLDLYIKTKIDNIILCTFIWINYIRFICSIKLWMLNSILLLLYYLLYHLYINFHFHESYKIYSYLIILMKHEFMWFWKLCRNCMATICGYYRFMLNGRDDVVPRGICSSTVRCAIE